MIRAAWLVAAAALLAPACVRAHEVLHEIAWNRAVALRARFADGEALAYARYEIYAPADPRIPHQKGRTDRDGWLSFVPAAPGAWRVKVIDDGGHGFDTAVEVAPGAAAPGGAGRLSTAAFVLRPLVGLAAIGAIFAVLLGVYRRPGAAR